MDATMPITAEAAREAIEFEHRILQWVLSHLEDIKYAQESKSNFSDDLNKMKDEIRDILRKY